MNKLTACDRCEQGVGIYTLSEHADTLYSLCAQSAGKITDIVAEFISSHLNLDLGGEANSVEPLEMGQATADALERILPLTVDLSSMEIELDELIFAANSLDCSARPNATCPRFSFAIDGLRYLSLKGEVIALSLMSLRSK